MSPTAARRGGDVQGGSKKRREHRIGSRYWLKSKDNSKNKEQTGTRRHPIDKSGRRMEIMQTTCLYLLCVSCVSSVCLLCLETSASRVRRCVYCVSERNDFGERRKNKNAFSRSDVPFVWGSQSGSSASSSRIVNRPPSLPAPSPTPARGGECVPRLPRALVPSVFEGY